MEDKNYNSESISFDSIYKGTLEAGDILKFTTYDENTMFGRLIDYSYNLLDLDSDASFRISTCQGDIKIIRMDSIVTVYRANVEEIINFEKKENDFNHLDERLSKDEYYLEIAKTASLRSTCKRARVGCVIVYDSSILGTGYNGSLPGHKHCIDDDCDCVIYENHCIQTIHAEINAIQRAVKDGFSDKLPESVLYSTHKPCYSCIKTLAAFGITNIIFSNMYKDGAAQAYIELAKLNVKQVKK